MRPRDFYISGHLFFDFSVSPPSSRYFRKTKISDFIFCNFFFRHFRQTSYIIRKSSPRRSMFTLLFFQFKPPCRVIRLRSCHFIPLKSFRDRQWGLPFGEFRPQILIRPPRLVLLFGTTRYLPPLAVFPRFWAFFRKNGRKFSWKKVFFHQSF